MRNTRGFVRNFVARGLSLSKASDNAAIFFYGTPSTPSQIASFAVGAEVRTLSNENGKSVVVKWPDVIVTINIDLAWDRDVQLTGIQKWLSLFPERERTSAPVVSFLAELNCTTICYGSVISPGYDLDGKAATLLKKLLWSSGGFFFSHQSFYSALGERIAGLKGDPSMLGPK